MVDCIKGKVQVFYDGSWKEPKIGVLLKPSDIIMTEEGSELQLTFDDYSRVYFFDIFHYDLNPE
jgi:hypothetical protein